MKTVSRKIRTNFEKKPNKRNNTLFFVTFSERISNHVRWTGAKWAVIDGLTQSPVTTNILTTRITTSIIDTSSVSWTVRTDGTFGSAS